MIQIAIRNNIITEQEQELYEYSYETMFARIIGVFTLVAIGFLFNCAFGVIAFCFTFTPIRIYAGGFHARGYAGCYLASVVAFLLIVCVYNVLDVAWVAPLVVVGSMASAIIIFFMSPVADPNKPLDEKESIQYREKARVIIAVEVLAIVIMVNITIFNQIIFFMGAAMTMEAILLIIPYSRKHSRA